MRHYLTGTIAVAAVLFSIISCTKDLGGESLDRQLVKMTFNATSDKPDTDTKTEAYLLGYIFWQEGDAISVYCIDNRSANFKFVLESGAGTANGAFSGFATKSDRYFALYPYNKNAQLNSSSASNDIPFRWDGSNQKAVPGSFDPSVALMAACGDDTDFPFKSLCSFIKITTDFPCQSLGIYSADKNLAASDVDVTFSWDYKSTLTKVNESSNTERGVAAIVAEQGSVIQPGTYYIAVLPEVLPSFEIRATTTQGVTLTRASKAGTTTTLEPGKILNVGAFSYSSFTGGDGLVGSGTAADPYQIGNRDQFNYFCGLISGTNSANYISKSYLQTKDIDFGGETVDFGSKGFSGTYDGGGHKIMNAVLKNRVIDSGKGIYASALIYKANNAKIKNLTVECAGFESNTNAKTVYYGGFIGTATSTQGDRTLLENCRFAPAESVSDLSTSGQNVYFGGFIGYNQGNLKCLGCTNDFPVNHTTSVGFVNKSEYCFGGFVGKICQDDGFDYWCNFDRCRNNADIHIFNSPDDSYAGGIVGHVFEDYDPFSFSGTEDCTLRLVNVVNKGSIIAGSVRTVNDDDTTAHAGGLVGVHNSDGGDCGDPLLYNCLNSGDINARGMFAYAGGLMGHCYDEDTRVCSCANVGVVYISDDDAYAEIFGSLCGSSKGEYYCCAFRGEKILYSTDVSAENIHTAYSVDKNEGKLTSTTMNDLRGSVPDALLGELVDKTGFTPLTWKGSFDASAPASSTLDINF